MNDPLVYEDELIEANPNYATPSFKMGVKPKHAFAT